MPKIGFGLPSILQNSLLLVAEEPRMPRGHRCCLCLNFRKGWSTDVPRLAQRLRGGSR
jgi:hypothetical protein